MLTCFFSAASRWPEGSYAVPQSIYGCPNNDDFPWVKGHISLTAPHSNPENQWSMTYHMRGPFGPRQVALHFCSRLEDYLIEKTRNIAPQWPSGNYCIYRMDVICPTGEVIHNYKLFNSLPKCVVNIASSHTICIALVWWYICRSIFLCETQRVLYATQRGMDVLCNTLSYSPERQIAGCVYKRAIYNVIKGQYKTCNKTCHKCQYKTCHIGSYKTCQ